MGLQCWIGGTDLNGMLCSIGGWHVGCENAQEAREAVKHALEGGLIGYRTHYAPAFPEGVLAFEVRDQGIEQIRRSYGDASAEAAIKMRQWYRDRTAAPPLKEEK